MTGSARWTASPSARRRQVVGLLGPNGAGKTTVIRMLVGLIRPDSGSVYVNGQPVHAGADVLSSVGAFIEGPGFLPHLSGKANLTAYWNATGRPWEEAHLDEALEIAGLRCSHRPQGRRVQPRDASASRHRPGHARTAALTGTG